ncbi:MAG: hypothetical protein CSA07_02095 [Bacteroidia bacterium]|nr:MAG: hypothetical protein CSA07_02095 [Bacteroidia bacterium]
MNGMDGVVVGQLGTLQRWYLSMQEGLHALGLPAWVNGLLASLIGLALLLLIATVAYYVTRGVVVYAFTVFARRTRNTWDDKVLDRGVIQKLCHVVPAGLIYLGATLLFPPNHHVLILILHMASSIYAVVMVLLAANALLNAVHDIYQTFPVAKTRPIMPYLQLVKIAVFFFGGIIIVAILVQKSPLTLLFGLSAVGAMFMFVFKDTILGLVASILVSANDMVKPDDWITVPSHGADGVVLEITLNTVKVQNWDRTIVTFPTYALMYNSCINWKGMTQSAGRRIARHLNIDVRSIHVCSEQELDQLERIDLIADFVRRARADHRALAQQEGSGPDPDLVASGHPLTNVGLFRQYVSEYLRRSPVVDQTGTIMARMLDPTPQGLPIQVYCFSNIKDWVQYEEVKGQLFDHLYAVLPAFNLEAFQELGGNDIKRMGAIAPRA